MLPITNILVPIVLSPRCLWSLRYSARMAAAFGAQLIVLNVSQDNDEESVERFVADELKEVPHKSVVIEGDPADRIIELTRKYRADLVIMPTYHSRYRRFLIGSVTAKVLHDVECPVLTGIHRYGDDVTLAPQAIRKIVCALDDSPECVPLYRWAYDAAQFWRAELILVHALPAVDETSENCGEVDVRSYLKSQAKAHFASRFAAEPTPPVIHICGGEIASVVHDAALSDHADLVIIGRGHADRTLGLLRTHTYSIIRNSPCPVLSV